MLAIHRLGTDCARLRLLATVWPVPRVSSVGTHWLPTKGCFDRMADRCPLFAPAAGVEPA